MSLRSYAGLYILAGSVLQNLMGNMRIERAEEESGSACGLGEDAPFRKHKSEVCA